MAVQLGENDATNRLYSNKHIYLYTNMHVYGQAIVKAMHVMQCTYTVMQWMGVGTRREQGKELPPSIYYVHLSTVLLEDMAPQLSYKEKQGKTPSKTKG